MIGFIIFVVCLYLVPFFLFGGPGIIREEAKRKKGNENV
jgi:hypothetical protein